MQTEITKAKVVFERINKELMLKYKGKIVAIDIDSGDYFVGDSEIDAYKRGINQYPNKKFVFKRIGFDYTHFVGAL